MPTVASASTCIDAPTAAKNSTRTGIAPCAIASRRTSPAWPHDVLHDEAGGEPRKQRLEVEAARRGP